MPSSIDDKRSIEHAETAADAGDTVLPLSPAEDARIRRKIDRTIMPLFCLVFMIQFLDKSALTYSSIMGFIKHSGLKHDEYSWLGSIFYIGFLAGGYPMIYLQQRLPLAKFTAGCIVVWGVVVFLMTVCGTNYAGLLATRFFLGFLESCISPALMLFTAQWYKVSEQGSRTGLWSSCNTLGLIFGSLVSWALLRADKQGTLTMYGWKVLYMILGSMTVVIGIAFALVVPDTMESAWFLSVPDRELAARRVAANRQNVNTRQWKWYQVREAFTDFQCWAIFAVSLLTAIPNGGITNFSAIIVNGMGFSPVDTLLLGMCKAWVAFFTLGTLWAGDKLKNRSLVSLLPSLTSVVGATMVWALPASQQVNRLAGYQLMLGYAINHVVCASFISSNVAGRTKKTAAFGMYFVPSCIGNLIGPQTFREADAPRYVPALITIVVCNLLASACMAALFVHYYRENHKRDRAGGDADVQVAEARGDLTDMENPKFRYHY